MDRKLNDMILDFSTEVSKQFDSLDSLIAKAPISDDAKFNLHSIKNKMKEGIGNMDEAMIHESIKQFNNDFNRE